VTGLLLGAAVASTAIFGLPGANAQSDETLLGDLPLNPEWLANTVGRGLDLGKVTNNVIPGAIERRDKAVAEWNVAVEASEAASAELKTLRAEVNRLETRGAKSAKRAASAEKLLKRLTSGTKAARARKAKALKRQIRALTGRGAPTVGRLKRILKSSRADVAKTTSAIETAKGRIEALSARATPDPHAKPEYTVVWSSKQNAADINASQISQLVDNLTINPQGILDLLNPQFLPGLDGFQVIDMRKRDLDGTENPDYGKVVNFVQLPLPWGVETEAHHMQYQWEDGEPVIAGALFNSTTFVMGVEDIPNMSLKNAIPVTEVLGGSIPDAYDAVGDGRFIGTYMGGPVVNFGGSPGAVVTFKPDAEKGLVKESLVPAGNILGIVGGNEGGVPEPCTLREARPLGTCANPHGIQIRQDLKRMVTADYAEPREIVLDPIKTIDKYAFRPTVRVWDTSTPERPKLVSVAHLPDGPFKPAQRAHDQRGIMEDAKTWPYDPVKYPGMLESKGMFAGSMCGGGVFFTPDITALSGDSSDRWQQVWNDALSQLASEGDGEFLDEPAGCPGGAWHQVSRNNKLLFRAVQGRAPGADNYFDQGIVKMLYDIDVSPLIESAKDGQVACDLSRGTDVDGDGKKDLTGMQTFLRLADGEAVADCPKLVSTLKVKDPTSGGPHWGALDNHSLTADGSPTRLVFSNYFVSRTGIDGDHRFYAVDIDPETHRLTYDRSFRDENTGALGVNFNRRDWPGSPDAGFYKPHSMLWVCPPGICPKG
jgi:hypothetical protein